MARKRHALLIFHGSARETASNAAAVFVENLKKQNNPVDFSICFLRGAEPTLEKAIETAIDNGCTSLRLIPLFLLPGSHIDEDIPAIIEKYQLANPHIEFEAGSCLVHNPQFIKFVANEIGEN
ncbi:MAG: hypothetical protein CVV42_17660 [Candidatus Riflebacteria bacterium HGW-Riflebacteria-2]|jgi:sirohydrochlorin ferrochelatase|nr:MAG: hypothetical protein CVV42_17660 [Candidatus Riflebacteria bacterium HGW-Riflebacteria-2]